MASNDNSEKNNSEQQQYVAVTVNEGVIYATEEEEEQQSSESSLAEKNDDEKSMKDSNNKSTSTESSNQSKTTRRSGWNRSLLRSKINNKSNQNSSNESYRKKMAYIHNQTNSFEEFHIFENFDEHVFQNSIHENFDLEVFHRAVRDAGRWAFGTIFVEVWVMNESNTYLERPRGGWWIDPVFHQSSCKFLDCPMCRLCNHRHNHYVKPEPLAPGVGLPGTLWSEIDPTHVVDPSNRNIVWRQVKALAEDPDQPWNPRLKVLAETGVGWAAAVPFVHHPGSGARGIVVYMAREGVNFTKLQHKSNENYLRGATDVIASAYNLRKHRMEAMAERKQESQMAKKSLISSIQNPHFRDSLSSSASPANSAVTISERPSTTPHDFTKDRQQESCLDLLQERVTKKVTTTCLKLTGSNTKPPPPFTFSESFFTFFGVFIMLLAVTQLNELVRNTFGHEYGMILGPFGAISCLFFGLTKAPAAQPRNAFLGHCIAMPIAIGIQRLPYLEIYMKQSLATALVVAMLVKLGLVHPPACATTLIVSGSNGVVGFSSMPCMLIGIGIAICISAVINDLNDIRQYPTFWGFRYIKDMFVIYSHEEKQPKKREAIKKQISFANFRLSRTR